MQLLTKEIINTAKKNPKFHLGGQDGKGLDSQLLVKFFNPCGAGTWLITEMEEQDDGDFLMYGYCHIFEWEWGYVSLNELVNLRCPPFGLGIEREMYTKIGTKIKDLVKG
jgi:hypothetical protein